MSVEQASELKSHSTLGAVVVVVVVQPPPLPSVAARAWLCLAIIEGWSMYF
jgi:hypothetical protein